MELVEDPAELLGRDADAGVRDVDPKSPVDRLGTNGDRPLVRVLHRVADQVEQDLLELVPVRDDPGQLGVRVDDQLHARTIDERLERIGDLSQHLRDVRLRDVERDLAGLDAGEIEDLVDQRQQMLGADEDLREVVDLPLGEGLAVPRDDASEADDRVQRRAELVAHVGEENALGGPCLHGRVAGHLHSAQQLGQLRLAPLLRRDVDVDAGDRNDVARAVHAPGTARRRDVLLAAADDLRLAPVRLAGRQHVPVEPAC